SQLFQQVCSALDIKSALSTAFHPQTDGETERVNQEVGTYLHLLCANNPSGWVDNLPMFEWFHNSSEHSAMRSAPSQLLFGYTPKLIPGVTPPLTNPFAESRLASITQARNEALATLSMVQQAMRDCVSECCPQF